MRGQAMRHELRSAVLCGRHGMGGSARVLCALRSSPPEPAQANMGELATRRNGPAVGHTPMLLLQLQLAGAPRSSCCCTLSAVRARTPQESACVRACVCVHGGKLGVWAWAWGGWHRERGAAAAQNARCSSAPLYY